MFAAGGPNFFLDDLQNLWRDAAHNVIRHAQLVGRDPQFDLHAGHEQLSQFLLIDHFVPSAAETTAHGRGPTARAGGGSAVWNVGDGQIVYQHRADIRNTSYLLDLIHERRGQWPANLTHCVLRRRGTRPTWVSP